MTNFDKLYNKILLKEQIEVQLDLTPLIDCFDLFLQGINLAAMASENELWDNNDLQTQIEDYPEKNWLFFELNGEKIGTVCYRLINNLVMLSCFSIFEEFQHQGLGKLALQTIVNKIKYEYKDIPIGLRVNTKNLPAYNLYQKFGFKPLKKLNNNTILMSLI